MTKRVLLVDDMAFMRSKIKAVLTALGHEVVAEADNGDAAIEQYKECQPDVVFLDITMPGKDGITALQEIIEYDADAKVIMISATGQEQFVRLAVKSGALTFIVKPFEADKIKQVMQRV